MEQDFIQQEGLDSSILNPNFIGGGNRPIGRGKRIGFRRRVLPFYGYYGANGEMVMMSEPAPMLAPAQEYVAPAVEQSFAPAPIVEQSVAPEPVQVVEQSSPVPVFTPTEQVVEQNSPAPVFTPTVEQSYVPAPTENYIPNNNVVIAEALPPQFSQPIVAETYSAPIVMATNIPTQTQVQTNIPSQTTTTTSSGSTSTTTAPKPVVTGGGMPMGGGGGGGVPPASKPATTTTTTTVKAPNGVVQQKTTTTTFEKQGMSMGMKIGIVAVLAIGGYFAYKNRAKLGF